MSMNQAWLKSLKKGDKVFWNDPTLGLSSGVFTISNILPDAEDDINEYTTFCLHNKWEGDIEVFASELAPVESAATVSVRLTMDVTYVLNGERIEHMISRLRDVGERAIKNGMLTNCSEAEIDTHSISTTIQP